jgi:hypothetical protein
LVAVGPKWGEAGWGEEVGAGEEVEPEAGLGAFFEGDFALEEKFAEGGGLTARRQEGGKREECKGRGQAPEPPGGGGIVESKTHRLGGGIGEDWNLKFHISEMITASFHCSLLSFLFAIQFPECE